MTSSLGELQCIVIGIEGQLRNPSLSNLSSQTIFIEPVFLQPEYKLSFRSKCLEFILNGRLLTKGERGCSLAHINARTTCLTLNHEWFLVLEDDVELPSEWRQGFAEVINLRNLSPGVVLLNTDRHFDLGPELVSLRLRPSGTNAYIVHKDVLKNRPYIWLEKFELADWPISFSGVQFYSLSGFAKDAGAATVIGFRRRARLQFLASALIRLILLPLSILLTSVPISTLSHWTIFSPITRDVALRLLSVKKWVSGTRDK